MFENNEFDDRKIQAFVNRVERLSGQSFEDYATLVHGLSLHINPRLIVWKPILRRTIHLPR